MNGSAEERKLEAEIEKTKLEVEKIKNEIESISVDIRLKKQSSSLILRILTSQSTSLLFGFLLTGIAGGIITNYFTEAQQANARLAQKEQRLKERVDNFNDELTKQRINKISEVWEATHLFENDYQEIYDKIGKKINRKEARILQEKLQKSERHLREILTKNRFWIGKILFDKTNKYIELSRTISETKLSNSILGFSDDDQFNSEILKLENQRSTLQWDVNSLQEVLSPNPQK